MNQVIFTRKELYDLIWSEPTSSIFKKYNLSYSGLKKICTSMDIPLPKSGHWQKIQFGKAVSIEPLSSEYSGEKEITLFLKGEGDQNNLNLLSPIEILQQEIEHDFKLLLIVPDKLTKPDELIIPAKGSLTQKRPYGLHNGLAYTSSGEISICAKPENVARALCFMDTFIKLLRARGHRIEIKNNETLVFIGEQDVKIAFREKTKRVVVTEGKYNSQRSEYHPSGILALQARVSYINEYEWMDGKLPLEKQLAKIVTKLEIKAKEYREHLLECWRQNDEREEKERIKEEHQKRKEKELSDFKRLIKEADRWRQVKVLRNYIEEVEAKAIADNNTSEELKSWLEWAKKKVNWYDPYIESEDELLKGVNRKTLSF